MEENDRGKLTIGDGILHSLLGHSINMRQICNEFIDNSLGARANNVLIRFRGRQMEIIDDGEGCPDLGAMESPAKSIRAAHNRAGMYGIGGVLSQIHASRGGLVEVSSVHRERVSHIGVDWLKCIQDECLQNTYYYEEDYTEGTPTGTTIRIQNAKRSIVPRSIG